MIKVSSGFKIKFSTAEWEEETNLQQALGAQDKKKGTNLILELESL